ncbi:MAG: hypothetical protein K0Q49_2321 [Haloplasmataceae bacterium]|jgi:hypothetical protein|nr:hypothetical protein [Haloplasmataceae bacterium]
MVKVKSNERSWAINLISEINIYLKLLTLEIKKAGGETGISTTGNTLFPDLLLYGDELQTQILQGWEIKMPDVSINNADLILNAEKKATMLSLNSFVLWNFSAGVLYVLNHTTGRYEAVKSWSQGISQIITRDDVELYRDTWLKVIKEMIIEINDFIETKKINPASLEIVLSTSLMASILSDNKPILADYLKNQAVSDAVMQSWLQVWWNTVKEEYINDEKTIYTAYSKIILLNWLNKIIFAHLIKKYHTPVKRVMEIDHTTSIDSAIKIFEDITNQCDFFNIFSSTPYLNKLPTIVWKQLVSLNIFLSNNGIGSISQESLQTILESTVQTLKREIRGQYTTPPVLADILTRITVRNWNCNCIDPCGGTGTIAKALLNNKKDKLPLKKAYETTWVSDKYTFPLQIANISLVDSSSMNIPCQIFNRNAFEIEPNLSVNITNPSDGKVLNLKLPKFHAITSNLPFVPFEIISNDENTYITKIIDEVESNFNISLNRKSDIYVYIIISLWKALEDNGRLGIIISNSWLASDFGIIFKEVIQKYFHITDVVTSGKGRWFKNAKVVTTMLILEKKNKTSIINDKPLYFSLINKELNVIKDSPDDVNTIVDSINLKTSMDESLTSISKYSIEELNKLNSLHISWNSLFYNVNWLLDLNDKLCPINNIFNIIRGSRRGKDEMFFPAYGHGIESKYIIKGLKTMKSISSLVVDPSVDVFCCSSSLEELNSAGDFGAMNWINKFSVLSGSGGRTLPEKLDKERNKTHEHNWYELNPIYARADFVSSINPNKKLFISKVPDQAFINQRVTGLTLKSTSQDKGLIHALMNSILVMFYIEAIGFGRGEGVLDLTTTRFSKMMVLKPDLLTEDNIIKIKDKFQPLLSRNVLDTELELEREDRKEFDLAILRAYGMDKYYEVIKSSLLNMQKSRLSVKK